MTQMYEVVISATGEVRDEQGNLISATPVSATFRLTEEEVQALTEGDKQ